MKKQLKFNIEVGDSNYVKPGEYFAELTSDGKEISAIYRREDDLSLKSLVSKTLNLEDNKAVTASSASVVVTPTSGKDAMKKATVTIPLETKSQSYSISSLAAGTVEITPTQGKLGMTKVTLTFTE